MQAKQGSRKSEFDEKMIQVNRVCRTVKGGRRMSFRVLVAVGNRKNKVGIGVAKAKEVLTAIQKAVKKAKKNLVNIQLKNGTIPHEIKVSFGSALIYMKPASKGTTIIAGSSVRSVLELAGVKDILTKIIGSSNKINNAKATILALSQMRQINTTDEDKNIKAEEQVNENKKQEIKVQDKIKS